MAYKQIIAKQNKRTQEKENNCIVTVINLSLHVIEYAILRSLSLEKKACRYLPLNHTVS